MMMMIRMSVLLITFPIFFIADTSLCVQQINDEVLGLIVFKSHLHDPYSHLSSSWNDDDDAVVSPCSWDFIRCDPSTSRVSHISLDGLGLSGDLAAAFRSLLSLPFLNLLSLSSNNFTGPISPEICLLPRLRTLNLSHNSLTGSIPSSLLLPNGVRFLDLSHNSLSGPLFPTDPALLDLNSSSSSSSSSSSLRFLSLAENSLDGTLPARELRRCAPSLSTLNLSGNRFAGDVDFSAGMWNLTRLRTLDLSRNVLSGLVPRGVSAVHFLKEVKLQGNRFSGPVPPDMGFCPHLNAVDLGDNMFAGALPGSLRLLSSLGFLRISNNMLSGDFPDWIGNMSSLRHLDFSGNELMGDIPASLAHCNQLSVVRLGRNKLSGSIPSGILDLGLEELDLSGNQLEGPIPRGSSRFWESASRLDLSGNRLTGTIPAAEMSNLRYLNLSRNNLRSELPREMGALRNLTVVDLRNSGVRGSIPGDICGSGSLGILQLDENSLTGPIPEEMGNCSSLYLLSLSHNCLNGSIPESISRLSKLRILSLEFNKLTGDIPRELGKLENLLAVNVSYNRLIGRLPVGGIFQSLDRSSLQGNLGICSPLLQGPCKMDAQKPLVLDPGVLGDPIGNHNNNSNRRGGNEPSNNKIPAKLRHHRFLSVSVIIVISAATIISLGVMFVSLLNVSAHRMRPARFIGNALEGMRSSSSSGSGTTTASGRLVLFDSKRDWMSPQASLLNNMATEIGRGVFGTVYKVLPLGGGGESVAIKRLSLAPSNAIQNQGDFEREVRILGKARHPNLITLRGYQWTPQMQLLVSDYAPNGSLQAKLHERPPSTPPLSWVDRFKILHGMAKGLAHLHHSFIPPIIHCSIKPTNILLDEQCDTKISDFGLARLVRCDGPLGTFGYAAPELACQGLRINEKCDVYGFGVILLELVTGRRAVEYGEDSVVILCDNVRAVLEQGNVLDCVDSSMGNYPEEEVLPILKLGLVCTSQIPSSRPSMAQVLQILQVIKAPVQQTTHAPPSLSAFSS